MTSPEERVPRHDISRGSNTEAHLQLGPGLIASEINADHTPDLNQQILELKKKQELQKQMLLHTFQEQTKRLELQHKLQLEHKYQYAVHGAFQELREQRIATAAEEQQQRERRERETMKRKENCSANASPEVKQILNCFIMNRKQAASSNGITTTSPYRNRGVVKSSSGESLPVGAVASSHPYKMPQPPPSTILKYDSDFPLRKTASEPNLLKIRLKQSVIERKARISGPAGIRRHERILQAAQRRQQKQNSTLANSSTNDSGPNSPPSASLSSTVVGSRGSPTSAPIQEENEEITQYQPSQRSSINDLSLFSSPSMPNISLGRPHLSNTAPNASAANFAMLAALRQHASCMPNLVSGAPPTYYNPLGVPYGRQPSASMMSANLIGTGTLPPTAQQLASLRSSPVVRSSSVTSTSSSQASLLGVTEPPPPPQAHAASVIASTIQVGQTGVLHSAGTYGHPITDIQVAHAHLNKQGHRPLGRTQSAPLPLGHPMLTGVGQVNIGHTHYENTDAERQAYEQHLMLTQKIRQTVLTRSGISREPQLKEEDDAAEVIDLTDKKKPPKTILTCTVATTSSLNLSDSTTLSSTSTSGKAGKLRDQEYLQHQRELLCMQSLQVDDDLAMGVIRPLSRTLSSPLVHMGRSQIPDTGQYGTPIATSSSADNIPPVNLTVPQKRHLMDYSNIQNTYSSITAGPTTELIPPPSNIFNNSLNMKLNSEISDSSHKITTGLAYDNVMLKHACICGNNSIHPEHSGRLQSVWARLIETDLAKRCDRLRSRKATLEELQVVHTEAHATLFGSNQINRQKLENVPSASFVRLSCGGIGVDLDTTWNEHHTALAARMAAGCVIDLAFKTAKGDVKNGFAVVRPPGHHAERNLAMGFCFFNSVAIAAKLLRHRLPEIKRILIVDWDVHHGNGTQQAFYDNADILYMSIHRHDDGNFFPGTGGPTECGSGPGLGFNVNISWSGALNPPLGDAEYIAAFRTILMPIAKRFDPDIVLVSAGFDAASGHPAPLGGYLVSPACFGFMTQELMKLAKGKIVLALEGGYDLPAICDSAQECVRALLGDPITPISESELNKLPCQNAIDTIQKTIAIQLQHWPCVRRLAHTVGMSAVEAVKVECDESDTVTAMAGLSMQPLHSSFSRGDSEEPMDQDQVM